MKIGRLFLLVSVVVTIGAVGYFAYATYSAPCSDSDTDGLDDCQELDFYALDPFNPDSDGDGFKDGEEIDNGYSPHQGERTRLEGRDTDGDGLSDALELAFGSLLNS